MKEKNIFDVLENADTSVIDRIAAEFPPQDNKEKERIFNMSERKFNTKMNNISKADVQSVSGVEIYKKPKWQRFLSIAAVFAVVAGGITGGSFALRHLKGNNKIATASEDEAKIAPFGNFAEFEYKLCDNNDEIAKQIIVQYDEQATILLNLCGGSEISQAKRQKLADFFNNYDYSELPEDTSEAENGQVDISVVDIEDERSKENGVSFVSDDGNEARSINIYEHDGIGVLSYSIFHYEERDGELYMTDEEVTKGWQIDYDLFVSTINAILSAEDENVNGQQPENVLACPFDLAAHDFYFFDPDSKTDIEIILGESDDEPENGQQRISLSDGKAIPLEKRQKLAEFFNSYNWEEVDGYDYYPEWLATYEQRGLFCIEDNEAYIIVLNKDTDTLFFSQLQIELKYDSDTDENYLDHENRFVKYRAIGDFAPDEPIGKTYKIDYDLFKSKMKEILGDDFRELPLDDFSFHNKEWRIATDESTSVESLSTDDKKALYDLLRKCSWAEGEVSNERLSTAEAMEIYENTPPAENDKYVILTSYYYDYHDIIYFEQYDDKTVVRYYDYGVQGENVPGAEYIVNIYNCTCDDANLVRKIKECLSSNNAEEVPVDTSFVDEVDWLYTSVDTRSFDITQDKMKKVGECLGKYNWSMTDESHDFGYDICIVGEWRYYLADLRIGFDMDGNTIIMFQTSEPTEVTGKKYPGAVVDNILDFAGKKYISSDKNAYSEIEKILSE